MRARHGLEYIELFENIVEYFKIFQKKATFFTVPAGQLNRELATEDLAPSQYALPEIHSGCWVASSGQVGNNLGQLGGNKEVVGGQLDGQPAGQAGGQEGGSNLPV